MSKRKPQHLLRSLQQRAYDRASGHWMKVIEGIDHEKGVTHNTRTMFTNMIEEPQYTDLVQNNGWHGWANNGGTMVPRRMPS